MSRIPQSLNPSIPQFAYLQIQAEYRKHCGGWRKFPFIHSPMLSGSFRSLFTVHRLRQHEEVAAELEPDMIHGRIDPSVQARSKLTSGNEGWMKITGIRSPSGHKNHYVEGFFHPKPASTNLAEPARFPSMAVIVMSGPTDFNFTGLPGLISACIAIILSYSSAEN